MARHFSPDFEERIRDRMASGRYGSEKELLVLALQALDEDDEELRAIEEGLASIDRGDPGIPLADAFERLRQTHQLQRY